MISRVSAVLLFGGALTLAACETARQVEARPPTVTYAFANISEFDEVEDRADNYCGDRYGTRAVLIEQTRADGGYEATFACT